MKIASNTGDYFSPNNRRRPQRYGLGLSERSLFFLSFSGLLTITLVLIFYGLGDHGIVNGNESLYIASAREMLRSGDLAIPTLNGLPYLEKPPLFVWLLAVSTQLFGIGEFAPRLVTALASLALIMAVTRFSKTLGITATGISAGYVLITSVGIDVMSRVAMPDMFLTALFAIACLNFLAALQTQERAKLRICAALLGAASISKGLLPVALFFMIVSGFYCLHSERRSTIVKLMLDPVAAALLCLPLSLWLLAIEYQQSGAMYEFIVNEHIMRYLGLREPHDYYSGSVFYYIPRLILFFFPWVGVLGFAWWADDGVKDQRKQEIRRFLWLCVWVPFGFFTLSKAKANYYIILCLPAMAMLLADYLPALLKKRQRIKLVMSIVLPIVLLLALWLYRFWALSVGVALPALASPDGSMPLTLGLILALAFVALLFVQLAWRRAAIFCLGGLIFPLSLEFNAIVRHAEPMMSARTMATYIQENFPDRPVLMFQDFESFGSLPIYLGRTIPIIDSTSADLYSGKKKFPHHPNFLTSEQMLASDSKAMVVVMKDKNQFLRTTKMHRGLEKVIEIGPATLYMDNKP